MNNGRLIEWLSNLPVTAGVLFLLGTTSFASMRSTRRSKHLRQAMTRCAFLSGIFGLCSACVQGPDYAKPAVEIPATYRFGGQPAATGQQLQWWNAYHD